MIAKQSLPDHQVHVWYSWMAQCNSDSQLAYYRSLLSDDENKRYNKLAFDHLKQQYLLTRALCRLTLSGYMDIAPQALEFTHNKYGKPIIDNPNPLGFNFNLSHVGTLVACVVARDVMVGVDVEKCNPKRQSDRLAARFLSSTEYQQWQAHADPLGRFHQYWTLKEAYVKARGMGLSLPLQQLSFDLCGQSITVQFDAQLEDIAEHWQFGSYQLGKDHQLAVAIGRKGIEPFTIISRPTIPS